MPGSKSELNWDGFNAVLFDLDGVLTDTARIHAAAWKRMFDEYLAGRAERTGEPFRPFEIGSDYVHYVDGKPRFDGVRDFLASQTNLSPEELRKALSARRDYISAGALTPREREVLRQLARGGTTTRISKELSISRATVNNHVQHILFKLGAHSRMEAVRRAESAGIL